MSTPNVVTALAPQIENLLINGDLSKLDANARLQYYRAVCQSVGLNPLTKPFEYLTLNGRLMLYARKDATDQLRSIHKVGVTIQAREVVDECYVVTARAITPDGRTDESIGAVALGALKGDAKCNALMKAETKAKRRVTLSICGLGMLDETEIETIPGGVVGEVANGAPELPKTFRRAVIAAKMEQAEVEPEPPEPQDLSTPEDISAVLKQELAKQNAAPKTPRPPLEYITAGQAVNLHKEFRKVVEKENPGQYLHADQHFYQALMDLGFLDEFGEPSSSAIPASRWFEIKGKMMQIAKSCGK
jgi:hypothetical protein